MNNNIWRLPAEWEQHQATLLAFPHQKNDWPGKFEAAKWAFIEIIRKVADDEQVVLIVNDSTKKTNAINDLKLAHVNTGNVKIIEHQTNRNWMRDSGPIVVKNNLGQRQCLQFGFTGWAKYRNYLKDRNTPQVVAHALNLPFITPMHNNKKVVLEGGAIDINGKGTLITTRECLLHPSVQVRNKGFLQTDYEQIFNHYLGVTNTIWLNNGIVGDDTHGHVDDICRFVNETTVVAAVEHNTTDPNHHILKQNIEILENSKLQDGSKINVVQLPMPGPLFFDNIRLPASYINFLITNKSVLVPTFNDPNDPIALQIIANCFKTRKVIGINATDLVWGFGTLHCLSHEITA